MLVHPGDPSIGTSIKLVQLCDPHEHVRAELSVVALTAVRST